MLFWYFSNTNMYMCFRNFHLLEDRADKQMDFCSLSALPRGYPNILLLYCQHLVLLDIVFKQFVANDV